MQDAPPTVAGVTPQAGATGVGDEINVTATFSERLRPPTVDGTTFVLVRKGTSTRVPAVVRYDAERNRAVLNPSPCAPGRPTWPGSGAARTASKIWRASR